MIKILRKLDKPLLISTVLMFIFGLLMIFSASYVKAITALGNAYYFLIRQGAILIVCFFAFLILIRFPLSFYKKMHKIIIISAISLLENQTAASTGNLSSIPLQTSLLSIFL